MNKYDICKGCSNLMSGNLGGVHYKCCGGNVDNPSKCVLRRSNTNDINGNNEFRRIKNPNQ
jgi:hypothetical protein